MSQLVVEITTRDEKTVKHTCNDYPTISGEFITLYKENFTRELVRTETVEKVKYYFKK